MWNKLRLAALLVALGVSTITAQNALQDPVVYFSKQVEGDVGYGNGLFLYEQLLVATSSDGTVTCFHALTGEELWEYSPQSSSEIASHSGVAFTTENAETPYMVYSIIENENSLTPMSLVVALDMDGNELWVSDALSGVASGTPVISDNGESVFLTHNSEVFSVGHFSILEADAGTLSYNMSDPFNAFAPPGIYHNPAQGWYDGGEGNFNDMIMWTVSPPPFATSIGEGLLFGFQYPPDPLDPPAAITLGDVRNFQGITPPVMTNEGKSAYLSVSRSNWFTWVGIEGLKRTYFSRSHTANIGFTRNAQFKGQPCFAPPALSSSTTEPVVFGGTAAAEFVRTTFDFSQKRTKTLSSIVYSQAVVDPADRVVYYAESAGFVHRGNFVNLNDNWVYELEGGTQGEIALSENGSILYVADTGGKITALQVAEIPATAEPSAPPSGAPSAEPTLAPAFPTPSPSGAPTTPLPTDIASAPPTGVSAGASKQIWAISLVAAAASLFLN